MLNLRTFSTIFSMQVLGSVLWWGRGCRQWGEDGGGHPFPVPLSPGLHSPLGAQHGAAAAQPSCHVMPAHLADLRAPAAG